MAKRKPYKQGYNPATGDIVIVCSPEDVQEALGNSREVVEGRLYLNTISKKRAKQLMKENEEALTRAYQQGWNGEWGLSIRDVLGDKVTDEERTTKMCW